MVLIAPAMDSEIPDLYYDPVRLNRRIIPSIFPQEQSLHNMQRNLGIAGDHAATVGKEGFHAIVDVHHYTPDEVSLKTSDRYITIECKHEERKDDHGFITRHFARRYALPVGYDSKTVTCELSSDGILSIRAPKPVGVESEERQVPIKLI